MAPPSRAMACGLCRARKLKCNHEFPCSNCKAHGIPCLLPPQRSAKKKTVDPAPPQRENLNQAVLSRLDRLEALIISLAAPNGTNSLSSPGLSASPPNPNPNPNSNSNSITLQPLPSKLQNLSNDALILNQSLLLNGGSIPPHDIHIRIYPLGFSPQPYFQSLENGVSCCFLPTRHVSNVLVQKYLKNFIYLYPIVHGPSLANLAARIHDRLEQDLNLVPAGSIILLISLFAYVVNSCHWDDDDMIGLFSHPDHAHMQAAVWMTTAFDILDKCERNSEVALENVQGLAFLIIVLIHSEGITMRTNSSLARAISMARDLGLHKLDQRRDGARFAANYGTSSIELEIGRRLWWHLASTDWMVAICSGPRNGTYSINTHQMIVNKPLNLDDEDILDGVDRPAQPIKQPTSMSYFLQKIRLTEKIKLLIDRNPVSGFDLSTLSYECILEADEVMVSFIREAPRFLLRNVDGAGMPLSSRLHHRPEIAAQQLSLESFVMGLRCRLHLPYIARGTVEPGYEHSRKAALESAQLVVSAWDDLKALNKTISSAVPHMFGYFSAVAVLVVDFCLATHDAEKAEKRQQVESAWRVLKEFQHRSKTIMSGIQMLESMMHQNHIHCEGWQESVSTEQQQQQQHPVQISDPPAHQDSIKASSNPQDAPIATLMDLELDGLDPDSIQWDSLQWVLSAPFM